MSEAPEAPKSPEPAKPDEADAPIESVVPPKPGPPLNKTALILSPIFMMLGVFLIILGILLMRAVNLSEGIRVGTFMAGLGFLSFGVLMRAGK
jgi:hypothetical protein